MSDEDKKPEVGEGAEHKDHIAKTTDYKEVAIKTVCTIAESTMLIVGEASGFLEKMSRAGAEKIKNLAEKRSHDKSCDSTAEQNKTDADKDNKPS